MNSVHNLLQGLTKNPDTLMTMVAIDEGLFQVISFNFQLCDEPKFPKYPQGNSKLAEFNSFLYRV